MTGIELAAGAGVLAGAGIQSATGFGFALVAAPLVVAATTPERAVGLLTLLGLLVNLLTLGTEGRRPKPMWREVGRVLIWAMPAALAGVLVLRRLDHAAIQLAVSAGVIAALGARAWAGRHGAATERRWHAPLAGAVSGALTTTTSTSGPPLVVLLTGRGERPERIRDTLTMMFLGLGVVAIAALALTGTTGATPRPAAVALLVPVVVIGHLAGRRGFALLRDRHYEKVLTGVLLAAVAVGLASTLA